MQETIAKSVLLLMTILGSQHLCADDKPKKRPVYPARLKVESQRFDDQGKLHIRVNLEMDADVRIFANPVGAQGMDHAATKLTVLDAKGHAIETKVRYPKGERLSSDFLDDYYLYKKMASIDVVINDAKKLSFPLTIQGRVAGYNERGSYCLGSDQLEVQMDFEKKNAKPTDALMSPVTGPDLR